MIITLIGDPLSTNQIYKSTCRGGFSHNYMSGVGKSKKEDYQLQAKSQWKKEIICKDLEIGIKLYFKDKRRRDWDNYHKLSMDALTGIVWKDDCQIQKSIVEKFIDKAKPRIEIEIK